MRDPMAGRPVLRASGSGQGNIFFFVVTLGLVWPPVDCSRSRPVWWCGGWKCSWVNNRAVRQRVAERVRALLGARYRGAARPPRAPDFWPLGGLAFVRGDRTGRRLFVMVRGYGPAGEQSSYASPAALALSRAVSSE